MQITLIYVEILETIYLYVSIYYISDKVNIKNTHYRQFIN